MELKLYLGNKLFELNLESFEELETLLLTGADEGV